MTQNNSMNNTSGQGKEAKVPEEIRGWSWGAFLLNWIWGIGNNTHIALLMLVPFINLVMLFILGAKGNEWAWKNRFWRDVDHFKSVQRKWALAGLVIPIVVIPLILISTMFMMKNSEAYTMSLEEIRQHSEISEVLGQPINSGFFITGGISTNSSGSGDSSIQYSVSGPKGKGKAYVEAHKRFGNWQLEQVIVDISDADKRIAVIPSD